MTFRKHVKRIIGMTGVPSDHPDDAHSGYLLTGGAENSEPGYYVIRQEGARGLFSLTAAVVCHAHVAKQAGLQPVVDFANYPTVYNDVNTPKSNAWEYYFLPLTPVNLDEVYASRPVMLSTSFFPEGYPFSISRVPYLRDEAKHTIKVRPEILTEAEELKEQLFSDHKILGVHWRGQEMRTAPGHWFPPTRDQMVEAIRLALDKGDFEKIFVVTEDEDYLESLVDAFGLAVISLPNFRTRNPVNAYRIRPRHSHMRKLGKEVLLDALLLSKASALIACTSNVAEGARLFRNAPYEFELKIDNGPNSSIRMIANYAYAIKDFLPERLGGFSSKAIRLIES